MGHNKHKYYRFTSLSSIKIVLDIFPFFSLLTGIECGRESVAPSHTNGDNASSIPVLPQPWRSPPSTRRSESSRRLPRSLGLRRRGFGLYSPVPQPAQNPNSGGYPGGKPSPSPPTPTGPYSPGPRASSIELGTRVCGTPCERFDSWVSSLFLGSSCREFCFLGLVERIESIASFV